MNASQPIIIPLRIPPFLSPTLILNALLVLVFAAAGILSPRANSGGKLNPVIFWGVYLAVIGIGFGVGNLARRIYLRRKGGLPPILLDADALEFPIRPTSFKTVRIPYADLRSVITTKTKYFQRVIIDTQARPYFFRVHSFADAEAPHRLLESLRERISAMPEGEALWAEMDKRHTRAEGFLSVRPWVTWTMLLVIALAYAGQVLWMQGSDLFGLLDLGANAPGLTAEGQWYRVFTANLLHANPWHILNNAIFAYVMGMIVERQLGSLRFLILVLVSGVLSQITSAVVMPIHGSGLYSVGLSGALFGILGAQAVLNRKFGKQLPGGYRFAQRAWWTLLGVNFVVVPLAFPEVDIGAHAGGMIAGAGIGWLLCRTQQDIGDHPRLGMAGRITLAGASASWVMALVAATVHAGVPENHLADRARLIEQAVSMTQLNPIIDNELAWSAATHAAASDDELNNALTLAIRAVEAKGTAPVVRDSFADTMATLYYRLGDLESAIEVEEPLSYRKGQNFSSQLGRFLNAYLRSHDAPRVVGDISPRSLRWNVTDENTAVVQVERGAPLPNGVALYALVQNTDNTTGLIRIVLKPHDETGWRFSMKPKDGVPHPLAQAISAGAVINLAQFNSTDCECQDNGLWYLPMERHIAELP